MDFSKTVTLELTIDEAIELLAENVMAATIIHMDIASVKQTSNIARILHSYFNNAKQLKTCHNLSKKLNALHDSLKDEIEQIEQEINDDRPESATDVLERLLKENRKIDPRTN